MGDVDNNLNRADSVLSRANPKDIDLLVLPELAFSGQCYLFHVLFSSAASAQPIRCRERAPSRDFQHLGTTPMGFHMRTRHVLGPRTTVLIVIGYNFRSLQHITPYLEPTTAGITSLWARTTALKYNCVVTAGYPEKVDVAPKWPAGPEYYNSAIMVNAEGETIGNYRKSFLYYTDETWALEGSGFFTGTIEGLGDVAMGICECLMPIRVKSSCTKHSILRHGFEVSRRINLTSYILTIMKPIQVRSALECMGICTSLSPC